MKVVIAGNFDVFSSNVTVTFPSTGTWYEYFSQSEVTIESTSTSFSMIPGEYRMYSSVKIDRDDYIVTDIVSNPANFLNINVFPNPASSNFSVGINSPKHQKAKVFLVDLNGRKIADLFNGTLNQGENTITWSKKKNISPGVYLCVLETSGFRKTTQIVIE